MIDPKNITPKQRRKLEKLAKVVEGGNVAILEHLFEMEDMVEELMDKMPDLNKVLEAVKGVKGDDGINGNDGMNGRDGIDGKDGQDGKDGKDGKDGMNGEKGEKGEKGDKGDKGDPGDIKEVSPQELRDMLELLQGDERLSRTAIKGLDDELKRIESIRNISSGGVTNLRIQQAFKYILKTEQPVGNIDGVNTTYTVSHSIFAVLAFSLNGETIAQLPNYTISCKSITFSSALPAAYSGKDFEIKYI